MKDRKYLLEANLISMGQPKKTANVKMVAIIGKRVAFYSNKAHTEFRHTHTE